MAIATNVQQATDANWNTVADTMAITVAHKGAQVTVSIADGDQQLNKFQRETFPGSGTWKDIKVWQAAVGHAVILYQYVTQRDNESLRVFMQTDGGGAGAASLTEVNRVVKSEKDDNGRTWMNFYENGEVEFPLTTALDVLAPVNAVVAGTLLTGAVKKEVVAVTAAVAAADSPAHAGKLIQLTNTTGFVYELPAATGSGDVYEFIITLTVASGTMAIESTEGAGFFVGEIRVAEASTGVAFMPDGSTFDFVNMTGGTIGGILGSWCRVIDAAVDTWNVDGFFQGTGDEATPFAST